MSGFCRDVLGVVALVSKRVRRGVLIVWTCPAWSGLCRDVFVEVGLVSGRDRLGRVIVGTCSEMSV